MHKNTWAKEKVDYAGNAFIRKNKKVVKGPNYGFITVPNRLIGKFVTVIIDDGEVENESEE